MIISPRLAPPDNAFWTELGQEAPDLASRFFRAHARALASGTPPPPRPDPSKVPAARIEALMKELGALPPDKVLPAFQVKTPDEQLALTIRLAELKEWPPALVAAQMTIVEIQAQKEEKPADLDSWKGRRLGDTLRPEAEKVVQKAVLHGHGFVLTIQARGTLSGLTLVAGEFPTTVSPEQFSSRVMPIDTKSPPDAIVSCIIHGGTGFRAAFPGGLRLSNLEGRGHDGRLEKGASEIHTHSRQRQPPMTPRMMTSSVRRDNPWNFEKGFHAWTQARPGSRGPFSVMCGWQSS